MEDQGINAEQLKAALADDFDELVAKVQAAMNAAKPGRIIAGSEEPVRDAEFRQRAYQKAMELLQATQESFSPSAQRTAEQGQAEDLACTLLYSPKNSRVFVSRRLALRADQGGWPPPWKPRQRV